MRRPPQACNNAPPMNKILKTRKLLHFAAKVAAGLGIVVVMIAPMQGIAPVAQAQFANVNSTNTPGALSGNNPLPSPQTPGSALPQSCNDWSTCISGVVYIFTTGAMTWFAYIGGYFFSFAVQIALNSVAYSQSFVTQGWAMVRDIANMAFIFILIYLAITIIFQAETHGTMKTLAMVIIMALLINFSFFITRIVIDAGNIVAVQFYNQIQAPSLQTSANNSTAATVTNYLAPGSNTKDLTAAFMQALNIQQLYSSTSFNNFTRATKSTFLTNLIIQCTVYIAVGVFLAVLGFAFLTAAFKFVMRVVVLWFLIMAAPIAFAARALTSSKVAVGLFNQWKDALIRFSFYPAVFLFIFYFITVFLGPNGIGSCAPGGNTATNSADCGLVPSIFASAGQAAQDPNSAVLILVVAIANVAIRLGFAIVMLYYGMKASDWVVEHGVGLAGSAGNWITKTAGGATRGLGRATAGGGAWTARQTVGRGAYAGAQSATVQGWAARSGLGMFAKNRLQGLASSRMDVRGTPGLKGTLGGAPNFGKGGIAESIHKREQKIAKEAKGLKPTPIEEMNAQNKFRTEYDALHGKGTFDKRVEHLQEEVEKGRQRANKLESDAVKTVNPAMASALRKQAKDLREGEIKRNSNELNNLQSVGKKQAEQLGRERIKRLAERMEHAPGYGSKLGAHEALKLVQEKNKKEKLADAARDAEKERREEEGEGEGGDDHTPPTGGGTPRSPSGGGSSSGSGASGSGSSSTSAHGASTGPATTGGHDAGHALWQNPAHMSVTIDPASMRALVRGVTRGVANAVNSNTQNVTAQLRAVQNGIQHQERPPQAPPKPAPERPAPAPQHEVPPPPANQNIPPPASEAA